MTERVDQAQLLHVPMGNEQAKEEKRERGEKGGNQNSQTKVGVPNNLSQMRTRKKRKRR